MGREVKRVPLDFDWPIGKIWYGYSISLCNDDYCEECKLFARIKGMPTESWGCPIFDLEGFFEPPSGDGWQMWEDTSEGSPISPVFATSEELARWLADSGASSFGSLTATYDQWLSMIQGPGWSPSAVMIVGENGGHLMSGVEDAARWEKEK